MSWGNQVRQRWWGEASQVAGTAPQKMGQGRVCPELAHPPERRPHHPVLNPLCSVCCSSHPSGATPPSCTTCNHDCHDASSPSASLATSAQHPCSALNPPHSLAAPGHPLGPLDSRGSFTLGSVQAPKAHSSSIPEPQIPFPPSSPDFSSGLCLPPRRGQGGVS